MARIGRAILAVLAGAMVWAALWVGSTRWAQGAYPELLGANQAITHTGVLLALIAGSVVLSLLAGYVTATVGGTKPMPALWALATLQLTLGIIAEAASWRLAPVWYHLVFLALVVPATVYGGLLRVQRGGAQPRKELYRQGIA